MHTLCVCVSLLGGSRSSQVDIEGWPHQTAYPQKVMLWKLHLQCGGINRWPDLREAEPSGKGQVTGVPPWGRIVHVSSNELPGCSPESESYKRINLSPFALWLSSHHVTIPSQTCSSHDSIHHDGTQSGSRHLALELPKVWAKQTSYVYEVHGLSQHHNAICSRVSLKLFPAIFEVHFSVHCRKL